MRPGTKALLAKAERAAAAASAALESGAPEIAAGRAFYALLYAGKVRLNERGVRLRAHSRIAAALARVAATEPVPLHEWLTVAIQRRRAVDADALAYSEVAEMVEQARAAVAATQATLPD